MRSIPTENFRNPAAVARFAVAAAFGLALDLWTKSLAQAYLQGKPGIAFIPGWLHFEYTENRGAVFGIGQGQRFLFLIVSVAAIFFLTYLFATGGRSKIYQLVLGMLLAGVIGNMYDRIVFHHVRDMIHALPKWDIFPWVFNVADSLLCVGVFLMIVHSAINRPSETRGPGFEPKLATDAESGSRH